MIETFQKLEGKDYLQNFYRFKLQDRKLKNYLLTTDDGNYIFINDETFKNLKKGKITNQQTYNNLISSGIIVTPNNISNLIQKTKNKYEFLNNGTSLHIVIPTDRCNLGCSYCFASPKKIDDKTATNLDEKTSKKIVEFIMNSPSKAITIEFQGGEATANFEQVKVMSNYAKELNKTKNKHLILTMVSNLTLMTEEMMHWVIDNDVSVCTSLDGPEHVHDKNRIIQGKNGKKIGTHKLVTSQILKLNNLYRQKGINRQINSLPTITKYSLPYYKEIIDEHFKYNLNTIDIRGLTQVGEIKKHDEINMTNQEFNRFYINSMKYLKQLQKQGKKVDERMKQLYETKIIQNKPGYHTDFESPCGATTGQLTYHSDGKIYTCHEGLGREEFEVGDVFKDKWQDIFSKPQTQKAILNSMIEQNVKCDRCAYKPYCGTCMVENFYNFGKFNYYPTKTQLHHTTILQANTIFRNLYNELNLK